MTRNVHSLVRDLLSDTGRKEVKPVTEDELRRMKAESTPPKSSPVKKIDPEPRAEFKPAREVAQHVDPPDSSNEGLQPCEFGDNGKHLWTWEKGVKKCGWCDAKAPLDKRDSSTSWRAKVYGKK